MNYNKKIKANITRTTGTKRGGAAPAAKDRKMGISEMRTGCGTIASWISKSWDVNPSSGFEG